jgi:hypothetical protein
MVTDGSGELASRLLYEQRGEMYEDVELSYYSTYSAFPNTKAKILPSYEDWAGQYGPTGEYLRELYGLASGSSLTNTGVSDNKKTTPLVLETKLKPPLAFQSKLAKLLALFLSQRRQSKKPPMLWWSNF